MFGNYPLIKIKQISGSGLSFGFEFFYVVFSADGPMRLSVKPTFPITLKDVAMQRIADLARGIKVA